MLCSGWSSDVCSSDLAVHEALVVDQYRVAGAGGGEVAQFPALRRADAGDAFAHVAALDQHHEHPVDAVAVHAFGRGAAPFAAARIYAELVEFDMLPS